MADPLEEFVTEVVFEALSSPRLEKALRVAQEREETADLLQEVRRLEDRLEGLARDHYAHELISRREYLAARADLEDQLAKTKGRLRDAAGDKVLADLPRSEEALRALWGEASIDRRRNILAAVIEHVIVNPVLIPGWKRFDPRRVELVWRA